jgi:probable phosphoglycerate mutase
VRHGEAAASWGQSADPGLSELGHSQAAEAARALEVQLGGAPVTLISSPLLRAQETAVPLAAALQCDVLIDERFREIPSPVPLAERQDWLRGFMREQWPDQPDSLKAWRQNMLTAIESLESTTVVFTHFLVINALVGWYEQRKETLVFWPDNASVTALNGPDGATWVVTRGQQMQTTVN